MRDVEEYLAGRFTSRNTIGCIGYHARLNPSILYTVNLFQHTFFHAIMPNKSTSFASVVPQLPFPCTCPGRHDIFEFSRYYLMPQKCDSGVLMRVTSSL